MSAGDKSLAGAARQAVHAETAGGFAARVEAGDHLAPQIHHLAARVDAQAGARVVQHRRAPGGVERRFGDRMERTRFAEIIVALGYRYQAS